MNTRSVLECGSPLPLLNGNEHTEATQSAGGLAQAKTWRLWLICFSFLLSAFSFQALGQYSIDWHKISGGGGASTGGIYSVSGTIGQHDAGGPMTNGQYSVTGGFWVLPTAVQVAGAPTLAIAAATPGNATISWTPGAPGFVLQETWSLAPANWTNSPSGAANPITVPAPPPAKFYRLFKP